LPVKVDGVAAALDAVPVEPLAATVVPAATVVVRVEPGELELQVEPATTVYVAEPEVRVCVTLPQLPEAVVSGAVPLVVADVEAVC
jgi:hypothetical protein